MRVSKADWVIFWVSLLILACALAACTIKTTVPSPTLSAWQRISLYENSGRYDSEDLTVYGESHAAYLTKLQTWTEAQGIVLAETRIWRKNLYGHVTRSESTGWIVLIDVDQPANTRLFTLLHELGHVYSPKAIWTASVLDREMFAEMTAVQVSAMLRLDAWSQTAGYLAARVSMEEQDRIMRAWSTEIDKAVATISVPLLKS